MVRVQAPPLLTLPLDSLPKVLEVEDHLPVLPLINNLDLVQVSLLLHQTILVRVSRLVVGVVLDLILGVRHRGLVPQHVRPSIPHHQHLQGLLHRDLDLDQDSLEEDPHLLVLQDSQEDQVVLTQVSCNTSRYPGKLSSPRFCSTNISTLSLGKGNFSRLGKYESKIFKYESTNITPAARDKKLQVCNFERKVPSLDVKLISLS